MSDRLDSELTSLRRGAKALAGARKVLLSTGAGMSADSGVPTYRDTHGRWRDFTPFTDKGIQPRDIAHVDGYHRDPAAAWGFHEHLRRIMANAVPHEGYRVLSGWMRERWPESFLLTTNVDGLHRRAGAPEHRLWERYGNIWQLQCLERRSEPCARQWWPEPRTPFCQLDPETMRAEAFPRCPFCNAPARPRIQMDHDPDFLIEEAGAARYQRFIADGDVDVYLVVGTTLWFSWPEEITARPAIININPDPATHARYDEPLAITMGAEDALLGLDWMLRRQ